MPPNEAPRYELIAKRILKGLPEKVSNATVRFKYFPRQRKVADVITDPKPAKELSIVESYPLISLLPITAKLFRRLSLKGLKKIIVDREPNTTSQFGFRGKHSTTQQMLRIMNPVKNVKTEKMCQRRVKFNI